METIIFLLQMGELRMVGDCLCLCPSIYMVHGSQSVPVSGLIHPLPPTLGFITCVFILAKVSGPLGSLVNATQASPPGSGITDSWGPYSMGLESLGPMGKHFRGEQGFFLGRRQHMPRREGPLRGS